jgi:hypothetical protein
MTAPADNLRDRLVQAARTVPLRLGPNAVALTERGKPVLLNLTEADAVVSAVLSVLPVSGPCSCGGRFPLDHLHADTHKPSPECRECDDTGACNGGPCPLGTPTTDPSPASAPAAPVDWSDVGTEFVRQADHPDTIALDAIESDLHTAPADRATVLRKAATVLRGSDLHPIDRRIAIEALEAVLSGIDAESDKSLCRPAHAGNDHELCGTAYTIQDEAEAYDQSISAPPRTAAQSMREKLTSGTAPRRQVRLDTRNHP